MPGSGKLDFCEACAEGKFHRAHFKSVGEVQSKQETRCFKPFFGCTAYDHVPDPSHQKLNQKAVKMRLISYSLTQKGYQPYDEVKRKTLIRQDVTFNETDFGHSNKVKLDIEDWNDECSQEESNEKSSDIRSSAREKRAPVYYHNKYAGIATAKHTALLVTEVTEPTTLKKALESDHAVN